MLVIISDLHLNDGTTGATRPPQSPYSSKSSGMAFGASWRADGTYRPIERIDLVLLGDTLDLLRSTTGGPRRRSAPGETFTHRNYLTRLPKLPTESSAE